MPAKVVFLDCLPADLAERLEPYHALIAGYSTRETVLNTLFAFCEKDYYFWLRNTPHDQLTDEIQSKLIAFVDDCLDYMDTISEIEGIDPETMFCDVATNLFWESLPMDKASDAKYSSDPLKNAAIHSIRSLVGDAIANNQSLP